MTITTTNINLLKNDSKYARHRSVWKGKTSVLDSVVTNLKAAPSATFKTPPFYGLPSQIRTWWADNFTGSLPAYAPDSPDEEIPAIRSTGYSGVVPDWLGTTRGRDFTDDVKLIWPDFVHVFARRSDPGGVAVRPDGTIRRSRGGSIRELLFMCHTPQHFDLIYSKWGRETGKHWFFHWTSDIGKPVGADPSPPRPGIDVPSDDEDGEGKDND
jgi:hypothetical protein